MDVSKKAELLGKALEVSPTEPALLAHRTILIERLVVEYDRLAQYIPEARKQAEMEGGGDEDM